MIESVCVCVLCGGVCVTAVKIYLAASAVFSFFSKREEQRRRRPAGIGGHEDFIGRDRRTRSGTEARGRRKEKRPTASQEGEKGGQAAKTTTPRGPPKRRKKESRAKTAPPRRKKHMRSSCFFLYVFLFLVPFWGACRFGRRAFCFPCYVLHFFLCGVSPHP